MINFDHYIKFHKKFEDLLTKMKEDGEIFNTDSFGKMEELFGKWLEINGEKKQEDDLRVLVTYLMTNLLKPESYFKELRFLHEEIRLRNMVTSYKMLTPLIDMMTYVSHFVLGDPKKGFTDENFIKSLIETLGNEITIETFTNIYANLKAKNHEDPETKKFLANMKGGSELL